MKSNNYKLIYFLRVLVLNSQACVVCACGIGIDQCWMGVVLPSVMWVCGFA